MTLCVLTAQVWLCGGSVEVVPCSKIAHIERAHKPYAPDLSSAMRRNALRVADIWLDDYKKNVFIAWNVPFKVDTKIYDPLDYFSLKHYIFIFIDNILSNDTPSVKLCSACCATLQLLEIAY